MQSLSVKPLSSFSAGGAVRVPMRPNWSCTVLPPRASMSAWCFSMNLPRSLVVDLTTASGPMRFSARRAFTESICFCAAISSRALSRSASPRARSAASASSNVFSWLLLFGMGLLCDVGQIDADPLVQAVVAAHVLRERPAGEVIPARWQDSDDAADGLSHEPMVGGLLHAAAHIADDGLPPHARLRANMSAPKRTSRAFSTTR